MADKNRYPQIPSTVWWGVRALLQRTPNATIDERMLGVHLGVQEAAARAYLVELRNVGILTEENKSTPIAQKWRLDETYPAAVEEIVKTVYPEGLRHVSPPGDGDRQKAVSWFLHEGLGQGAAGNKAATYLMISSATPNEAPGRSSSVKTVKDNSNTRITSPKRNVPSQRGNNAPATRDDRSGEGGTGGRAHFRSPEGVPLNINVQIHISADAGSEQIESIFSAMRRYLYDTPNS